MAKILNYTQLPDFGEWTTILLTNTHPAPEIRDALLEAFKQGYYLGLNNGWSIERGKDDDK